MVGFVLHGSGRVVTSQNFEYRTGDVISCEHAFVREIDELRGDGAGKCAGIGNRIRAV